jgi:hypothetical protein
MRITIQAEMVGENSKYKVRNSHIFFLEYAFTKTLNYQLLYLIWTIPCNEAGEQLING